MRSTENDIAEAVLRACAEQPSGIATMAQCREYIRKNYPLTHEDLQPSPTRLGEKVWEQQVRNIQSHHAAEGNYIADGYLEHVDGGYKVTKSGMDKIS